MYFVYLLECGDTSIYTGITTDLARRFEQHRTGKGARYTSARRAVRILYSEQCPNRSAALKREAEIKSWKREKKLNLAKTLTPKQKTCARKCAGPFHNHPFL